MLKAVFAVVAHSLDYVARKTGLSYNEVNILVYYLLIPLSWTVMLDFWLGQPYTTAALLLVWFGIGIATRHNFREWCDFAFKDSVDFLNWFNRRGGNYILNSVIICVVVPLIVYSLLACLLLH